MEEKAGIRDWFDEGNERGMDFMLVARDPAGDLYPYYVEGQDETTRKAIGDVADGGDRVLEVYDLSAPFLEQNMSGRAWNTEETRDAFLGADRAGYDDSVVLSLDEDYVYHPAFTEERINALTARALAAEEPDVHELEAVQATMRERVAAALTEEIHEAHPDAAAVRATVADTDRLLLTYPTIGGRELYEAGIPSDALIEKAIARAGISEDAPGELHTWRERNPLSRALPAEAAAQRAAEFDEHWMAVAGSYSYIAAPAAYRDEALRRADALAAQLPGRADEVHAEYRKAFEREATEAIARLYPDEPRMVVGSGGVSYPDGRDAYHIAYGDLGPAGARAVYSRGVPSAEVFADAASRVDEQAVLDAGRTAPARQVAATLERNRARAQDDDAEAYSSEDTVDIGFERPRHFGR